MSVDIGFGIRRKEMNYGAMKAVVMEIGGVPQGRFDCTGDAARMFGITTSNMTNRIVKKLVYNNVLFRYPNEGEDLSSIPCLSPLRRRKEKPQKPKREKKRHEYKSDDVELNREKYTIVPYKVRNLRVCITRCAYRDYPQPLVGSAECVKCRYFKGRNKKTHEVACSNSMKTIR